ncbi:imidazoleglycerol-phosphate dehydratase [Bacillus sp. Marseille-P3661]|uniref:imidazoleglycerol-phosphate dehydratase n=1 Tax=Bacillus sp. Marseille-P3661 TaxID=1936234 RepID=UPI000C827B6F|nr:imidazoleglycerol-phosphate dehydratase [Bacillus sp. Marseille-P3661]
MTNRNPKFESKNQGSPEMGNSDVLHGAGMVSGDNNKGTEYRSKKGSKSKLHHHDR